MTKKISEIQQFVIDNRMDIIRYDENMDEQIIEFRWFNKIDEKSLRMKLTNKVKKLGFTYDFKNLHYFRKK